MEPVTHILTGACLARSGFNRRAAYATAAMAIAAEFPDVDTLWTLRGPVSGFEHHRGITHTLLGIPLEAAFLLGFFVLLHAWRQRRAQVASTGSAPKKTLTAIPVRWGLLYAFLLVALLSHLLLDYTNNYGLRPFFPFNPHWYAASIVFIFDPLIFILLLAGLLLPSVFALVGAEMGARRRTFRGAGWARAALVCIVVLWLTRGVEHHRAVALAQTQDMQLPAAPKPSATATAPAADTDEAPLPSEPDSPPLSPQRSLASPDPLSIFRWYTATDFGPAYRLSTADTSSGVLTPGHTLFKPTPSPALNAAEHSRLGRIYLDWSPMPWIAMTASSQGDPDEINVNFLDLRFMGSSPLILRSQHTPLTGTVVLSRSGEVLDQGMDGRFGR